MMMPNESELDTGSIQSQSGELNKSPSINGPSKSPPQVPQSPSGSVRTPNHKKATVELSDTDDEYDLSGDEDVFSNPDHLGFATSLTEHANYFSNTIAHALESIELDKSLALQAKLSGHLNNENQNIIELKEELAQHLHSLKSLIHQNFHPDPTSKLSKVEQMNKNLGEIESRIHKLKYGGSKGSYALSFLRSTDHLKVGVTKKYPIEYNQAKDKVIDRQFED